MSAFSKKKEAPACLEKERGACLLVQASKLYDNQPIARIHTSRPTHEAQFRKFQAFQLPQIQGSRINLREPNITKINK